MQNQSKHSYSSSAPSDDSRGNQDGDQKLENSSSLGGDHATVQVHAEGDDKGAAADEEEAEPEPEADADPSLETITDAADDNLTGGPGAGVVAAMVTSGVSADQMVVQVDVNAERSSALRKQKRRSELNDPPPGVPTCFICEKVFSSWKGVFGHMKLHPERPYRGFMPPPTFSANSSGGQGDNTPAALPSFPEAAENAPPAREAPAIPDLNEELKLEDVADTGIDLNKSPRPEDDINGNNQN